MKQKIYPNKNAGYSKRFLTILVLVFLFLSQSSCFQHYYQTNTTDKADFNKLKEMDTRQKYFILHTPANVFALSNIKIDSVSISASQAILNEKNTRYLTPAGNTDNWFRKKNATTVFSEVHIYTNETFSENAEVRLTAGQIYRVDAYSSDHRADKRSRTISIIGIVAVPVVLIGATAIALSSTSIMGSGMTMHF